MSLDLIKQLRAETGAGVMEIKKALNEADNDLEKTKKILRSKGASKAKKRADRTALQGLIEAYSHDGKIAVLVEVNCETDFVARSDDFKEFAHNLVLQIAAMKPKDVQELLEQEFIKDSSLTIDDLYNELTAKTGEKISISRFVIFELGKE